MELKEKQRGRLYLTNKATGEERVYEGDFKQLYNAFVFLEEGLSELFSAVVNFKYEEPTSALLGAPKEASAEAELWSARVVTEELYREENSLPQQTALKSEAPRVKLAKELLRKGGAV